MNPSSCHCPFEFFLYHLVHSTPCPCTNTPVAPNPPHPQTRVPYSQVATHKHPRSVSACPSRKNRCSGGIRWMDNGGVCACVVACSLLLLARDCTEWWCGVTWGDLCMCGGVERHSLVWSGCVTAREDRLGVHGECRIGGCHGTCKVEYISLSWFLSILPSF